MNQLHTGGGFIHLLAALAGCTNKLLGQVRLADSQLVHPLLKLFPFFLRNHEKRKTRRTAKEQVQKFKFRLAKEIQIGILANLLTRV